MRRFVAAAREALAAVTGDEAFAADFFARHVTGTEVVDYAPLPGTHGPEDPPHYRPINWGEFRAGRAGGDYADAGEEIQISHFRV